MTNSVGISAAPSAPSPTKRRRRKFLARLEWATGAAALIGGGLLLAAPDGSLLHADLAVLADSPFTDWRLPGGLLAAFVGGGFLAAGTWEWRAGRHARELSIVAGVGLIGFELAEWVLIGFQPLEAVFAAVGAAVAGLAALNKSSGPYGPGPTERVPEGTRL
jgi:hypothetical protein